MKRILIDMDKCDGCLNCSIACMQAHRADHKTSSVYDLDLTDTANESRNTILLDSQEHYIPLFCRHCDEPECVKACMSGAMTKDENSGQVCYDEDKCGACFMCVMNCPYGVLKPDDNERKRVIKCDFCEDDEEGPNCVRACPTGAIYIEEVAK